MDEPHYNCLPSDWHSETWAEVVNSLRDHLTELGFRVDVNPRQGTLTIIHGRRALSVMNVTGTHFDMEGRLMFQGCSVCASQPVQYAS